MSTPSKKQNVEAAERQDGESGEREPCPERSFINAIAAQLARTGAELEATSSAIASIVRHERQVHRDLMGALQSFDRLEQELATMAELLLRYAELAKDGRSVEAIDSLVLSGVRLADLKLRIVHAWRGEAPASRAHSSDDEIF